MGSTAEELRRECEELEKKGFPIPGVMDVGVRLGESDEIGLHFELYIEDDRRPFQKRWHPEDFFSFHREAGVRYLEQLLASEDREYAVCAAYLLAELLIKGRYERQAERLNGLDRALVLFAESEEPRCRRKALIALGWVGTEREIPTLERHLLTDADPLCRAWSASAFLQMSGRIPAEILKKTAGALRACIERESDVFVRGVAVETIQDIWKVKFGLRSSVVEARDQKAVDRAVRRALEYLNREETHEQQAP